MIDNRPPDSTGGRPDSGIPYRGLPPRAAPQPAGQSADLYAQLFQATARSPASAPPANAPPLASPPAARRGGPRVASGQLPQVPPAPMTLAQSGLTLMQVCDLILKQLYLQGGLLGVDIARQSRLPFNVIDEGLVFLKDEKCLEEIGRAHV